MLRPVKELKGFDKVALAPGETKVVRFEIKPDALKYFDDKAHQWVAEPGKFKALIGASSTDIRQTVPFEYEAKNDANLQMTEPPRQGNCLPKKFP